MSYRFFLSDWNRGRTMEEGTAEQGSGKQETIHVQLDENHRGQVIEGFGGAFTRASALLWNQLSDEMRTEVLNLYFSREGAGYTLCRTPMGGCDFAEYPYTYDDTPNDVELMQFSIAPDLNTTIPMIQTARSICGREQFRLYACPWSPPAWMKDTQRLEFGGHLLPEHYDTMARYFVRFIQAYEKEGIRIWGLTAQNEPNECLRWPTCLYSAEEEACFLDQHLIPAMNEAGYSDMAVMIWDNNKDLVLERTVKTLEAMKKHVDQVYGVAFHWYAGDHFDQLEEIHRRYPRLHLLSTEACTPLFPAAADARPGVRYAHEMIGNFYHGACGFIDWNLFLSPEGGPSYVNNQCLAPITLDPAKNQYRLNEAYYAICHFSRFVQPGAVHIPVILQSVDLEAAAFLNPDHTRVIVMLNKSDNEVHAEIQGETFRLPSESVSTYIF